MIPVREILLTRVEGYSWECDITKRATSFAEAHDILFAWSETAPKGGGYDKVDFVVTFEDGETYAGRYDLTHWSEEDEHCDLARHMTDVLGFYAGRRKPDWMDDRRYRRLLERRDLVEQSGRFLDTYRIGDG